MTGIADFVGNFVGNFAGDMVGNLMGNKAVRMLVSMAGTVRIYPVRIGRIIVKMICDMHTGRKLAAEHQRYKQDMYEF